MRDPGAVVAGAGLALLVGADLGQGGGVGGRIVFDRDLRGHAAHGIGAVVVADVDDMRHVRAEERRVHRDERAVREDILRAIAEFFHHAEHVVPAAAVEARGVLAKFVEDFLRLEGGGDRLDQHGDAYRPAGEAERSLGVDEDVVPEPRLEVALHLGEIEVRAAPAGDEFAGVVEEQEAPIEERRRDTLAGEGDVLLLHVPAAGTRDDDGGAALERVRFSLG